MLYFCGRQPDPGTRICKTITESIDNNPAGPQIRVCNRKLFFLFLNQNICCEFSKESPRWDGSFGHPKHMFELMGKKIITISARKIYLTSPMNLWSMQVNLSSGFATRHWGYRTFLMLNSNEHEIPKAHSQDLSLHDDLQSWTPIFGSGTPIFWRRLCIVW